MVGYHEDSSTSARRGILLTSPDGASWTQRYSGTNILYAVAYGNGRFVVVGNKGEILTSPDGTNWSRQAPGINTDTLYLRAVSYGNGNFVALGILSGYQDIVQAILTSSDGISWTARNPGTWGGLTAVAYGAGSFVGVGSSGSILQAGNLSALSPNPTIFIQPATRYAVPGGSGQFTVSADGIPPLRYQWRFNSQNITGGTNATLALNSVAVTNEGLYSVVVWNGYGSVTSAVARLYAHLPPPSPQPPPPAATPTTQPPPAALTAAPRKPSSTQMVVFTGGGLMDPSKMTIVLTHGWKVSSSGWPTDMANALIAQGFGANANIVAWNWYENANTRLPSTAAARTPSEGEALGSQLLSLFGASYSKPIHFIGHSFGTLVNCRAADYVHGDAKNSPGHSPGSTLKFNPLNTHMTLFDEAELVTAVNGVHFMLGSSFDADTAGNLARNFWSKVIPDRSAWIDNYLSEVGLPHSEAANVFLWRNGALGVADSHGYAYQWYAISVANPTGGPMGHRWSFERNSLGAPPARGTYFLQNVNSDPWTLELAQFAYVGEPPLVAYPSLLAYRGLNALGGSVLGLYLDGIQYAGDFVANTAEMFAPLTGQPVFVGNANSTPAYYVQEPASQSYQAGWDLQFTLQGPSPSPLRPQGPTPADAGGDGTNCPVYVWMPVSVPVTAVGMSFEFRLEGANTNEYFTMGISNENYFTMEAKFVDDGVWNTSSVIEIPDCAGKPVQLFFALNGEGCPRQGKLSVRGIQFYSPPPPTLNIVMQGTNAVLSWPVVAAGWQLETVSTVASSNQWGLVTNVPAIVQYQNTVTNPISGEARFFRLKK